MAEGFVEVDGGRLFYEEAGAGRPVVFVHPGLWDRRTWDDQFPAFAERFRAIRYDVRGYGRSSRPEPGASYSHGRDLLALLDATEVTQSAFVGCSMGGGISIEFALEHPERVWALVPVASGLGGITELVTDGVDGLLIHDFRSPQAWAACFKKLCDDAGLLEKLRRHVKTPPGMDRAATEMIAMYESVLETKAGVSSTIGSFA